MKFNFDEQTLNNLYDNATAEQPQTMVAGLEGDILITVTVDGDIKLPSPKVTVTYGKLSRILPSDLDVLQSTVKIFPGLLDWAGMSVTDDNPMYCTLLNVSETYTNNISYQEIVELIENGLKSNNLREVV